MKIQEFPVRAAFAACVVALGLASTGCVVQRGMALPKGHEGATVCVVPNHAVRMDDFEPRLVTELKSRGFNVKKVHRIANADPNALVLTYTAKRTMNFWGPYVHLAYAKIELFDKEDRLVSEGTFKQRGGPFSMAFGSMYRAARTKMRPVFSKMFENYPRVLDMEF